MTLKPRKRAHRNRQADTRAASRPSAAPAAREEGGMLFSRVGVSCDRREDSRRL